MQEIDKPALSIKAFILWTILVIVVCNVIIFEFIYIRGNPKASEMPILTYGRYPVGVLEFMLEPDRSIAGTGFGMGYVLGISDISENLNAFCRPVGTTNMDLIEVVRSHMGTLASESRLVREEKGSKLIIEALSQKYPCQK